MGESIVLKRLHGALINTVAAALAFISIFPMVWMVSTSLKTQQEFVIDTVSLPDTLAFENYRAAIETGRILTFFGNSVVTTILSVSLIVIIGFVTGYLLARYRFPGRKVLFTLFLSGMLIPVHGLLVPIFIQFRNLGLLNRRFTLLFPYVAFGLPLAIFLFESFVRSIPVEMEEAACIDGLNLTQVMFRIILPMTVPIMATVIVMSFLHWWNEFPFALVLLSDDSLKTLPIGLANFKGAYSTNYTQLMAALVIAATPVIVVYLFFYRHIMTGMIAGAVKG
ncbi:MAG: carbohydrate ABC transporter permease [Spirochaetales bacterium]|nr:carbohydrate ABC transporter permease [Spirochaetales bacterium]